MRAIQSKENVHNEWAGMDNTIIGAASKLNRQSPAGRRRLRAVVFYSLLLFAEQNPTARNRRRLSFETAP